MPYTIENRVLKRYSGCKTTFTVPDSVTKIGWGAFYECTNLTQINIPEGVTEIGDSTFSWCINLARANIPGSVTKIGESAFQ